MTISNTTIIINEIEDCINQINCGENATVHVKALRCFVEDLMEDPGTPPLVFHSANDMLGAVHALLTYDMTRSQLTEFLEVLKDMAEREGVA